MKPEGIYFVEILPGGPPLKSREKGGGHFTQKGAAIQRYLMHLKAGRRVKLHHTFAHWTTISDSETEDD